MSYQLTPKDAKRWLSVVRELREYYEGKNDKFENGCPLCSIASKISEYCCLKQQQCMVCPFYRKHNYTCILLETRGCFICLWNIFEGNKCLQLIENIENKRKVRSSEWCKQSISRLKRWERELKKIMKGG